MKMRNVAVAITFEKFILKYFILVEVNFIWINFFMVLVNYNNPRLKILSSFLYEYGVLRFMRCSDVYVCVIWCCRWEAGSGWGVCGVPASRLQRAPSRLKGKQTQQTPGLSEDRWENSASLWRIRERAAGYAVSSPASRPWNEFTVISWCSLKQEKQLKSTLLALLTYTVCVGNHGGDCWE